MTSVFAPNSLLNWPYHIIEGSFYGRVTLLLVFYILRHMQERWHDWPAHLPKPYNCGNKGSNYDIARLRSAVVCHGQWWHCHYERWFLSSSVSELAFLLHRRSRALSHGKRDPKEGRQSHWVRPRNMMSFPSYGQSHFAELGHKRGFQRAENTISLSASTDDETCTRPSFKNTEQSRPYVPLCPSLTEYHAVSHLDETRH